MCGIDRSQTFLSVSINQHQGRACVCSHCSSRSRRSSSPRAPESRRTWTHHARRVLLCTKDPKEPSVEHAKPVAPAPGKSAFVPSKRARWYKKALARWKPRRFSLPFCKSSVAIVCAVAIAGVRVQALLYGFIYLLLFPFLAALAVAIRRVPATWKSKGAESCRAKQHLAESSASSGS